MNNNIIILSKEQFINLGKQLRFREWFNIDYLYDLYVDASTSAKEIIAQKLLGRYIPLNPVVLILYLTHEYAFLKSIKNYDDNFFKREEVKNKIISSSLDKYFTNEYFSFKNEGAVSKYLPEVSTLTLFLNFLLGVLKKYSLKNPKDTLLIDIMQKGFLMMKAMLDLIINGFATEAFSTWRTLHETECILKILYAYQGEVIEAYLRHMQYAIAFRGGLSNQEETDKIFQEIKAKMSSHNLKSKDMKKFIEYGYLYAIKDNGLDENIKLNFRDGVEKFAKLNNYAKTYEMASEIAHSSPILFYSRQNYFYHFTLLNVYETFFRMEEMFYGIYQKKSSSEEIKYYSLMRKEYLQELILIHQKELAVFKEINQKKS